MRGRDMSPRKVPFASSDSQSSYRIDNVSPRSSYRDMDDDDISVSRYRSPRMQRGGEPNRTYSTNSVSDRARSLSPRASRYSSSESVSNLRNKFEKQPPNPPNQGSFISPPDMSAPRSIIGHFVKLKSSVEESVHSEAIDQDEEEDDYFEENTVDSRQQQQPRRSQGYIPTHDYASWRHQSPSSRESRSRDSGSNHRSRSPRTRSLSPRPTVERGLQFPSANMLPAAPPKKKETNPPPQPSPPQQKEETSFHVREQGEIAVPSLTPRERPQQQQPQHTEHHYLKGAEHETPPSYHYDHHHHSTFERMVDETESNFKHVQRHEKQAKVYSPSKSEQIDSYNKTKPHHYAVNIVKDSIHRKTLSIENKAEVHYEKADAFKKEEMRRAKADLASKEMRKMKIDLTVNSAVKAALERVQAERKLAEMSQPLKMYKSRSAVKAATSASLTSPYSPEHGFVRRSLSDDDNVSESSTMTFEAQNRDRRNKLRPSSEVGQEEPTSARSARSNRASPRSSPDNLKSPHSVRSSPAPVYSQASPAQSDKAFIDYSKYSPSASQSSVIASTIKNATANVKYQTSPGYASPMRERMPGEGGEAGLAIVLSASRSAIKAQHEHEIGTLAREYEAKLKVAESKGKETYNAIDDKVRSMQAEHEAKLKELVETQDSALESLALESVALLSSESEKVSYAENKLAEMERRLQASESQQDKNKVEYDATVEALTRKSAARFAQYEDKMKSLEKKMTSSEHQLSQASSLHSDEIEHLEKKVTKLTSANKVLDDAKHEIEMKLEDVNKKLKIAEITIKHSKTDSDLKLSKLVKEHEFAMAKLTNELTLQKPIVDEDVLTEQELEMIKLHKLNISKISQENELEIEKLKNEQIEKLGKDFVQLEKDKKDNEIKALKNELNSFKESSKKEIESLKTKIDSLKNENEETITTHQYEILELNKMLEGYETEKKEMEVKINEANAKAEKANEELATATSESDAQLLKKSESTVTILKLENEIKLLQEANVTSAREAQEKYDKIVKELDKKKQDAPVEHKQSKTVPSPEIKVVSSSPTKSSEAKPAKPASSLNSFMSSIPPSNKPSPISTPTKVSSNGIGTPTTPPLELSPSTSPVTSPMTSPNHSSPVASPEPVTASPAPSKRSSLSDFMSRTPSQTFPTSSPKTTVVTPVTTKQTDPVVEEEVVGAPSNVSKLSAMFEKSK